MSTPDMPAADLNPHMKHIDDFAVNLHEYYAKLRSEAPIWKDPKTDEWLISGFDEVSALLKDSRLSPNQTLFYPTVRTEKSACLRDSQENWLNRQPEPKHTELRKEFLEVCSPQSVARLESFIYSELERLTAPLKTTGKLEFVSGLTIPLVILVFAKWLGVQDDQLREFAYAVQRTPSHLAPDEDGNAKDFAAAEILTDIFSKQTIPNSKGPNGESLAIRKERVDNLTLLVFGGYETLVNFVPNALLELLKHPAEADYFRSNPDCRESAVDELLRYAGSVLGVPRVVLADFEFDGYKFCTGDRMFLILAAANRDPKQFLEPNKLDFYRDNSKSRALGGGSRYCLGSYMIKKLTRITLAYMFDEFPNLSIDSDGFEYVSTYGMRGLLHLHLKN